MISFYALGSGHKSKTPGAGLHLAGHEFFLIILGDREAFFKLLGGPRNFFALDFLEKNIFGGSGNFS